jgi:hypothetical protein
METRPSDDLAAYFLADNRMGERVLITVDAPLPSSYHGPITIVASFTPITGAHPMDADQRGL